MGGQRGRPVGRRPGRVATMKLYVGARQRVFVTGADEQDLLCVNSAAVESAAVICAILVDYLHDHEQALAVSERCERLFGARLRRPFWTLRESELNAALGPLRS
jgi:hypothetical protein